MTGYLVLYRVDVGAEDRMRESDDDGRAQMQARMDRAGRVGPALVDMVTTLGNSRHLGADAIRSSDRRR
ncbi:hypothetical protein [Agromyces sp. SYSU T0242]|uniref:hypothetical protein n=1 Tax=Agromyces litoreus TaxID=3158561 RepID=UPI003394FE3E